MTKFKPWNGASSIGVSRAALVAGCMALAAAFAVTPANAKPSRKPAQKQAVNPYPLWTSKPNGPVIFVVSIADQRLTMYDNGVAIARTVISTGVPGHLTPRGVFSIIQKDRYHKSNIYSDAPMPYMQRITWSGVAMHEGHVTGHPASHGCIRLPQAFAARLWPYTKMGMRVIVSNTDVTPEEFFHPLLLTAVKHDTTAQAEPLRFAQAPIASASDARTVDHGASASIESISILPPPDLPGPLNPELTANEPAPTDAPTLAAPAQPPAQIQPEEKKEIAAPITIPPGSGHVAMFISKKEGKLFVRREFKPIFETPVVIRDPARPLGSHLFTVMDVSGDNAKVHWSVVDLHDTPPPPAPPRRRKGEPAPEPVAPLAPSSSAEALDRIVIPEDARMALAGLVEPGVSLIITDQGFGRETGKGTDFIVLTH